MRRLKHREVTEIDKITQVIYIRGKDGTETQEVLNSQQHLITLLILFHRHQIKSFILIFQWIEKRVALSCHFQTQNARLLVEMLYTPLPSPWMFALKWHPDAITCISHLRDLFTRNLPCPHAADQRARELIASTNDYRELLYEPHNSLAPRWAYSEACICTISQSSPQDEAPVVHCGSWHGSTPYIIAFPSL